MIVHNGPYVIQEVGVLAVGVAEADKDLTDYNGGCFVHNAGANDVYISNVTGVSSANGYTIKAGESCPVILTGQIYYIGAGVSSLRILALKAI